MVGRDGGLRVVVGEGEKSMLYIPSPHTCVHAYTRSETRDEEDESVREPYAREDE